jgi:hypothetical protein
MNNDLYNYGFKDGVFGGYDLAKTDLKPLYDAAILTLNENKHLCDGDNCTLKELRDAVSKVEKIYNKGEKK